MLDQKYLDEIHMQCHARSKVSGWNLHAMSCWIKFICMKFLCNVMLDQKIFGWNPHAMSCQIKSMWMKFPCNVMLNQIYLHEIPMQCHVRSKIFGWNLHAMSCQIKSMWLKFPWMKVFFSFWHNFTVFGERNWENFGNFLLKFSKVSIPQKKKKKNIDQQATLF
jgi:hypothetical protein